jgi:hypothetical protein
MQTAQWIIAAVTAIFVSVIAFLQWRTAQQKAVLDLFEQRHAIYETFRKAVGTIASNSTAFDQGREVEFMQAMERAHFFFGDDVDRYIKQLWSDIMDIRTADAEQEGRMDSDTLSSILQKRRAAMNRVAQFHSAGLPLFAKYMRFTQTVPLSARLFDRL